MAEIAAWTYIARHTWLSPCINLTTSLSKADTPHGKHVLEVQESGIHLSRLTTPESPRTSVAISPAYEDIKAGSHRFLKDRLCS